MNQINCYSAQMSSSASPSVGTNISEAWLIKALRLLHSQKPEDTARLRKLYKDTCENEAAVARITLVEALRMEPSGLKEDNSSGSERGVVRQRISAQGPLLTSESSQSDGGTSKSSKLINFFDLTAATSSTHASTASSKNRSPSSTANVPIIPVVVCQGKTIITEQSSTVVMTNSGLVGGNGNGGEANSPPVGMEVMEDLVADLMCCVCGRMTAAADHDVNEAFPTPIESPVTNNVLVECTRCRSLYHKLCHSPPLLTARLPTGWLCSRCSDPSNLSKRRSSSSPPSDPTPGSKKSKS
ncbi:Integrator complex subunit 12 [Taenia solium]|eukprot:TsM_001095200 transcript=TsM_001095200 gene=TsM_001095200